MNGLIVAWKEDEIQAINEENFQEVVVNVVESFFEDVPDPTSVTVIWKTESRQHGSRYEVTGPPQLGFDSCYIDIIGVQQDGEYRLELDPDKMAIRQNSNNWVEELTYLELKSTGVAIDKESHSISLSEIPKEIKEKAVRAAPDIEW